MQKLSNSEWLVMEVLWKKGLVSIDRNHEPHLYSHIISRDECTKYESDNLLNKVYQESVGDLLGAFLKDSQMTVEEKEHLSKILDEMEV